MALSVPLILAALVIFVVAPLAVLLYLLATGRRKRDE